MNIPEFNFKQIVFSLIAGFISATATYLLEKKYDGLDLYNTLIKFFNVHLSDKISKFFSEYSIFWQLPFFLLIFSILKYILSHIFQKRKLNKIIKRQDKFKQTLETVQHLNEKVGVKIFVYFDSNDEVHLKNIIPYCLLHKEMLELEMVQGYSEFTCPLGQCKNNIQNSVIQNEFDRITVLSKTFINKYWKDFKKENKL